MAHGLVQQNTGPSWTEYHFHVSRRSFTRVELQNCLARGLLGKELGSLVAKKEVKRNPPAAARAAAARSRLRLRDAGNIHARQRLRVFRKRPVGADHQNSPQFVGIAGAYFLDARIVSASRLIGAHQQFNLGSDVGIHRRQSYGIQAAGRFLLESSDRRLSGSARDQRRGASGMKNALRRKVVGVGIPSALAGNHAYAAARRNSLRGRLHQRLIHHQRGRGQVFEVEVGVIAARRKRGGEINLKIVIRKPVVVKEETFLDGSHHIWMPLSLQTTRAATALSHERNTTSSSCGPRASSNRRPSQQPVILSAAGTSRSEVPAESKDPYPRAHPGHASGNSPGASGFLEGYGFSRLRKNSGSDFSFERARLHRLWKNHGFVSGYRFSDTVIPSKSIAPLGAEGRTLSFSASGTRRLNWGRCPMAREPTGIRTQAINVVSAIWLRQLAIRPASGPFVTIFFYLQEIAKTRSYRVGRPRLARGQIRAIGSHSFLAPASSVVELAGPLIASQPTTSRAWPSARPVLESPPAGARWCYFAPRSFSVAPRPVATASGPHSGAWR